MHHMTMVLDFTKTLSLCSVNVWASSSVPVLYRAEFTEAIFQLNSGLGSDGFLILLS